MIKLLNFNQFINEELQKADNGGGDKQYNTSIIIAVGIKADPFDKESILFKPENQKKILDDGEKKLVEIIKNQFKSNEKLKESEVISANNESNLIMVKSDGNLYKADEKGELCKKILDEINKYAETTNSIQTLSTSIISFGENEKKEEVPAAFENEKGEWKEMEGFEPKDRSMKF